MGEPPAAPIEDPADKEAAKTQQLLVAFDRSRHLQSVGLWPGLQEVNPEAWLRNFREDEQRAARAMLDAVMYFNEALTDELLKHAFRKLAPLVTQSGVDYASKRALWLRFLLRTKLTHIVAPESEGDETKSGPVLMRKYRQLLGVDKDNIIGPDKAVRAALADDTVPIVVVDDFSGTGEDFLAGYERQYGLGDGRASLRDLRQAGQDVYFCPAVITAQAVEALGALRDSAPIVSAAHCLSETMSLVHPEAALIRPELRVEVAEVVRRHGERLDPDAPLGYKNLGLSLAFYHSTPDATLPVYWSEDAWRPLFPRR